MRAKRKRKHKPSSMWRDQFGLTRDPFALTPDPDFFFQSEGHAEALAGLKLGLLQRRGLIVLTGEVGTGKTTVVYSLLSSLDDAIETVYVSNTSLVFEELLEHALNDLGVSCPGSRKVDLLEALNEHLDGCARDGKTVALVIDEAQNLSDDAFENVRLLLNFETYKSKLLQIVLVGQPELQERLRSFKLRQIADRVAIYCHLQPLNSKDTRRYIEHRLQAAGGSSRIFTRFALSAIVRRSRGFPRRINIACHNAMLFAFGQKRSRIGVSLVGAGSSEMDKGRLRWGWP